MFGPPVIGKLSFVARTISSRFAYSRMRASGDFLARAERVHVGGVEEVDSRLDGLAEERLRGGLVEDPRTPLGTAEAHASQGEARDGEAGAA